MLAGFVTKFEPTYARGFLPCWDEPRVKSTFNVTVTYPANVTALSNTAVWNLTVTPMSRGDGDAYLTAKYEKTPPMPVYLLAFAVGPLTSLEMRTARNLPLIIWFPSESVSSVQYVATFSPSMFDRVESEFEVAYPVSKLDLVVVNNFPVSGMENWGLIVFQADALLTSSASIEAQNMTVDRIAEQYNTEKLVTHEIVHQWFGNLITPVDWSELWLSEGFTSYFVYEFLNQRYPHLTDSEYYMRLIQLVSKQSTTEKIALVREVQRLSGIETMFDGLHVYTKGAVIVKLIKDLIGPTEFRTGVLRFLKEHAFKSVSSDMLWSSLAKYADHGADKDILLADIMRSWLENPGIPEVIVRLVAEAVRAQSECLVLVAATRIKRFE
ncbi:peptidase family M1 containing protein [Aphelenchoides avenae]|nr:peptidase family M1 containing protein [Aphelenchus avenae]